MSFYTIFLLTILTLSLKAQNNDVMIESNIKAAASFAASDEIIIEVSFSNSGDQDMDLLIWNTPIEGFKANLFEIRDSFGNLLPYLGIMVKRGNPQKRHYVRIKAGETLNTKINLKDAYDLSQKGSYSLLLKFNSAAIIGKSRKFVSSESNLIQIQLD